MLLKREAKKLAASHGMEEKFELFERVERLRRRFSPEVRGNTKVISANVDFYSGLVYEMLHIPSDLYTPLFAVSRIAGWCAHRIEEMETSKRIMRPGVPFAFGAAPLHPAFRAVIRKELTKGRPAG